MHQKVVNEEDLPVNRKFPSVGFHILHCLGILGILHSVLALRLSGRGTCHALQAQRYKLPTRSGFDDCDLELVLL